MRGADLGASCGPLSLGLQDDQLPVADAERMTWGVRQLAASGARLTRLDILWRDVMVRANHPGQWERYDHLVARLHAAKLPLIVNLHAAPDWARTANGTVSLAAYEEFVQMIFQRYGHQLVAIEPWNEPNIPMFLMPQWAPHGLGGSAAAKVYEEMVRVSARARDRWAPHVLILGPSLSPNDSTAPPRGGIGVADFFAALPADLPLDGLAQHVYPRGAPTDGRMLASFARLEEFIARADARFQRPLPVFITEFGWLTQASPYARFVVTPTTQARFLTAAVARMRALPRIRGAVWFNLQDNPNWPSGLWTYPGRTPQPSWAAFRTASFS